jgi:hypothetical protein
MTQLCIDHKLDLQDYFDSRLLGGGQGNAQGNREFFVHAISAQTEPND